jgi:hypothetical protein
VREGAGQTTTNFLSFLDAAGSERAGMWWVNRASRQIGFGSSGNIDASLFAASYNLDGGAGRFDGATGLVLHSSFLVTWSDIALARSAPGILAVTDGSTGQGGIGLSDAATNTVSDALILRHQGGTTLDGFGTGLLFQGENDVGTMHDIASIDAVFGDNADTSEDGELRMYGMVGGAMTQGLTLSAALRGANPGISTPTHMQIESPGQISIAVGGSGWNILFGNYNTGTFWEVEGTNGHLFPGATNAYDFGTSARLARSAYISTSIQGTRTQAITDNAAAATFVTIAVPTSNTTVGGRIFYTITAIDAGTAIQTKTGTYSFGLNNIGGTVTGAGTDVLEHSQLSAGTLAPTFSVNISGTNAQFQLVLDTSLDAAAETLKIEYRVQIDSGTATVTPAT